MIELALLALVAQAGAARVVVESATTCPSADEVAGRLEALLPPLSPGATPARATLSAEEGALRVRLSAADGATIAERRLTVAASCADRANVAAVVIAAWELQLHAEHVDDPRFPSPSTTAPTPDVARATPPVPVVVAAPPPTRTQPGPRLELALGPALTFVDGGIAPTGMLALGLWGRRLGARLGLVGLLPRAEDVGDGRARWTRLGATFEGGVRASGRAGRLDVHVGFVAGMLVAQGAGFDLDHTTSGFSPGALAGVDWSYLVGRFFVGAGASLSAWTAQRLVSDAATRITHELPRLQPALGASLGVVF